MKSRIVVAILCAFICWPVFALQERHVIVLRHGESEDILTDICNTNPSHPKYKPSLLTDKGREQVKKAADQMLSYGFDNRSIKAVYVSTLPRAVETANILADIGLFSHDKIHLDERLNELKAGTRESQVQSSFIKETWWVGEQEAASVNGESSDAVRKRMLAIYDDIEKKHQDGHVLLVTHGMPSTELINSLTNTKVKLELAQVYLMPLTNRNELS